MWVCVNELKWFLHCRGNIFWMKWQATLFWLPAKVNAIYRTAALAACIAALLAESATADRLPDPTDCWLADWLFKAMKSKVMLVCQWEFHTTTSSSINHINQNSRAHCQRQAIKVCGCWKKYTKKKKILLIFFFWLKVRFTCFNV